METDMDYLAVGAIIAAFVVPAVMLFVTGATGAWSAAGKAKSAEERNLADKLAIEADKRITALDIKQMETFFAGIVATYLPGMLDKLKVKEPIEVAADYLQPVAAAWKRRNPELAAKTSMSPDTIKEKLAEQITNAGKDALAEAFASSIKKTGMSDPLAALSNAVRTGLR